MHKISWVFGYGSLMWDPGFQPVETVKAHLTGYSRSFCLISTHYRGTETQPGLVLGLDEEPAARCSGLAMRIHEPDHVEVMAYLHAREMVTEAYREEVVTLHLDDGRAVEALTYVMRRDHEQYAGHLDAAEQARIIATAEGGRGPNAEYLFNTARHLAEIGLADAGLDHLSDEVRRLIDAGRRSQGD
ncbi:gamma-glutamylcyclotransferase [Paracoccus caeni]|uniref:glutathione-specific gamma-glutamylcyclotransferase n=1 Tax=Paracoccus caeni TaxID=657651 RepID=A0A934VU05_9RHOB|nr:gamma-glutamylcyclotransferase [Paracoccus caeni]MBK4215296.1 gamma-glutamylcyclotransferase [Paracoccus caeni]